MEYIAKDNSIVLTDEQGNNVALIEFPDISENTVEITHTEVAKEYNGQGIAGKLTKLAAEHIRAQNKKAVLSCSYAINWFHKHQEYRDILKDPQREEERFNSLKGPACSIKTKP